MLLGLLLLTTNVVAQSLVLTNGATFPVTNTRYGAAGTPGRPVMASNGRDLLLVWWTPASIRVTKAEPGMERPRVGRPVLGAEPGQFDEPAVVWTGSRFLVASNYGKAIVGRLLFANGEAASEPFTILENAYGPQLASNGSRIVMLYRPREFDGDLRSVTLNLNGTVSGNDQLVSIGEYAQAVRWYAIASNGSGFAAIIGAKDEVQFNTFRSDGQLVTHAELRGPVADNARAARSVAISSNGDGYLVTWSEPGSALVASIVSRGGAPGATFNLEPTLNSASYEATSIAWTGTRYDVAYVIGGAVQAVHVAPNGIVTRGPSTPARGFAWTSVGSAGGRTLVAWSESRHVFPAVVQNWEGVNPSPFGGAVWLRELAFTRFGTEGVVAAHAATEQTLVTAASALDATLLVWTERTGEGESLWYGVRGRNGSWVEQKIAPDARRAYAASDGQEFMLVTSAPTGAVATHVSAEGQLLNQLTLPALTPSGVAWNGERYATIGYDANANLVAVLFRPTSVLSGSVVIRPADSGRVGDPAIASDGRSFLATWLTRSPCQGSCPINVRAVRLDAALSRTDTNELSFPTEAASELKAAWNGRNYGIAVINHSQVRLYRIPARGDALPAATVYEAVGTGQQGLSLNVYGERWAIGWRDAENATNHVAVVANDATVMSRQAHDVGRASSSGPVLLAAPGNLLAYVASVTNDDAPHHGAERVLMRIDTPLRVPGAPRLDAHLAGEDVLLEWTLPAGPVSGYRVEYRINDGSWNELEGWLEPHERSGALTALPRNASYTFRVRAWSEAGTSAYSNEMAITIGGRRRAAGAG